jgi:hypothetical protein
MITRGWWVAAWICWLVAALLAALAAATAGDPARPKVHAQLLAGSLFAGWLGALFVATQPALNP